MAVVVYHRNAYIISTDKTNLNIALIHFFLDQSSYWARGRSIPLVQKSTKPSLCLGACAEAEQVGFARLVTDYATFAWLCDAFILDAHRGNGLSKWLVECVTANPELENIRRFAPATRDGHELYRRYGAFQTLPIPDWWMVQVAAE